MYSQTTYRYGSHIDTSNGLLYASKQYPSSHRLCYQIRGDRITWNECAAVRSDSRFYIHAPMNMNMAGCAKNDLSQFSRNCQSARRILTNLLECSSILHSGVVIHCGNCYNREIGLDTLVNNIIYSLNSYTARSHESSNPLVLIECAAGSSSTGTKLGHRMEEIQYIYDECIRRAPEYAKNIGICLDTCHLHAAGYDLSSIPAVDTFLSTIDDLGVSKQTVLIHLNDSKDSFGSGTDNHAVLHNGYAFGPNTETLRYLVSQFYKRKYDIVLEEPEDITLSTNTYDISLLNNVYEQSILSTQHQSPPSNDIHTG